MEKKSMHLKKRQTTFCVFDGVSIRGGHGSSAQAAGALSSTLLVFLFSERIYGDDNDVRRRPRSIIGSLSKKG